MFKALMTGLASLSLVASSAMATGINPDGSYAALNGNGTVTYGNIHNPYGGYTANYGYSVPTYNYGYTYGYTYPSYGYSVPAYGYGYSVPAYGYGYSVPAYGYGYGYGGVVIIGY